MKNDEKHQENTEIVKIGVEIVKSSKTHLNGFVLVFSRRIGPASGSDQDFGPASGSDQDLGPGSRTRLRPGSRTSQQQQVTTPSVPVP
jgi:hypothetical protein